MANVRVAVRVRPLSKRETKEGGRIIVEVDGKVAKIRNLKVDGRLDGFGDSREKVVAFGFDYCYWSVNPEDPQYASQDVVFQDLGTEVLSGAAKGYNICLFAYGQTGSGKTYTMLGTPGLFVRQEDCAPLPSSCRIKVSFLEIYNERVRDLLKQSDHKKSYTLRVREHPEMGPYVQGLSQHVVTNYKQVIQLLEEGIANRITAATHVHEASSRSHAIFTIYYTQAILENNLPSEIASKINLVDLAGSERADPSYCKDRITEGANINKSLVTLGIVISTLAQNSQVFSCQSFNSTASDGGDSGVPSSPSGTSSGGGPSRRRSYIPYRDSVLTWLLKDSLGGNSRTIMVATVSPAHTSYSETMSTLRYASNAKNIINKPRVNEDANVKLIRELREEIGRLKAMLLSFELRNFRSLNEGKDENLKELVLQNELKIDQLTKDWTRKWNEWKALVEHYRVDINRRRAGLVIDSSLPHLMALEDDVLSTGVVLYHLKEGTTKIGRIDSDQEQDIVLQGQWIERDHCTITSACGVVVLRPARGARCTVNGREVTASCRLTQGAVITLGKAQKFRFNHPAEAAVLRQRRQVGEAVGGSGSLEWLDLDGDVTASRLGLSPLLWKERRVLGEQSDGARQPPSAGETPPGTQVQQQQCYVGDLRQRIVAAQIRARQTPELDRTSISRWIKDRFFWFPDKQRLLGEETRPSGLQQQPQQDRGAEREVEAAVPSDSRCRTDPETQPSSLVQSQKRTVQPQLLRRHTLRVAERSFRRRRVLFQLERIVKKQRLLEAHRRPELLKALCLLQDGHPQRRPGPGTLVPGPQCRSRLRSYSSLSLQRPCSWHSPQLRSVSLSLDTFTTSPPMPDPTDQLSEKISSEEYLPQATSYCPRTGHCSKHALRSSGKGQLCTARKALAGTGASAPGICFSVGSESASVQEMERVAFPELLMPEGPQGKERDLPEPENSESDDSQISEDSLAEKGCRSLRDSPGDSYLTSGHGHPRARAGASVRVFTTSSDSGLFTQTQKSFSLDSLIDTEEELGDHRQEEPFFISADEMPTETFWHLQPSSLPGGDQEAACRLGAIKHRTGARLDAILPVSSSFYLDPQPPCEQPELAVEANSSERAHAVQDVHLSRGSPLVSVDSWFSCDSKINPSSPSDSLCPSPNVQDFQPCGWKRPGYWLNTGELKSSGTEIALPYSSELPQGGAELPCSVRGVHAIPASDMTRLSLWGPYRLLQSGADGTFQARGVPEAAQQGISEASDSSVSSLLAASATSFTYIGSAGEREWAALQQKYLLELSHPALEATEEPRSAFASLEGDSGSLTQASDKGGDALLPVGSGVPRSLDFSSFPIHLSKIKRLRAEKEQDSLSVEIEGTSDFFTASEKVSCSGTYSADVESSASGMTHAQASAAENKTVHPVREAHEVKENSLEESSQSSQKPELMTSSDECFFLKSPCHSVVTIATKDHHRPRGRAPFGRSSADQAGQSGQSGQCPPQEENTDSQESSQEAVERHSSLPFALLSGPELYLHSAPWNPLPSSLQPPPLETFYVTKSRDALTETALEIPACREARMPSPPPREAWGFGPNHRVIQNVSVKNKLPVPSHNQNSKMVPSQQGTAERPVVQNTEEVNEEKWKRPGNVKEDNHNSVYFFVSQNRHFLPSTSVKVCEFENQVGILNKHSLPTLRQGEKASVQSSCGVSSDSAGSGEPLFVCEPETGGEEEQGQSAALRQTQAFDTKRQFHSGIRSELIYKTISLGLDKDVLGEAALSLKPRPVHHRVSSPETAAQEESPTHEGEGRNETGLLGKALHPKDGSEEFKFPQTESTCGRVQSVTRSQERNHSESKVPGKAQEMFNSREAPSGKKWNKQGNNADEMAKLIKSVVQLENGILEIESKQSKQLCASHTLGVSKKFVFQDPQDQERADCVLRAGGSGNDVSFKDQLSSPRQTDDVIFRDEKAGEMEVNSSIGKDPQVQKITLSPFKLRERVHNIKFVRGRTYPAVLDRPARDTGEFLGACMACTNTSVNPGRTKALAGALSLQPRPEMSAEEGELLNAVPPRGQLWDLGSLEELETVKGFQESQLARRMHSSKQEETEVQGRVEEMAVQRGGLQEEDRVVSVTQKVPGSRQRCVGVSFSQESGPLWGQPDSCVAPHQDLGNTFPLNSPGLPESYIHTPNTVDISSVDCVLDPMKLKMPSSPSVTGAGCQDQRGEPRSHGLQGEVRGGSPVAHSGWCGSVIPTAMASHGQSSAPGSIPQGTEGRRSASTSPQHHAGDLRSTSTDLSSRVSFPSKAKASIQRGTGRASSQNRASSPFERKASYLLEERNSRDREVRPKAEEEAKDLSPARSAFSAPVSLPRVPQPEPSAHPPTCQAVLEGMGQAETQGKQLQDLAAGGTVLHYDETSLEPESSSRAPGRPQCPQVGQPVSDRTRNEGEAQGNHVASLSAEPGHLSIDERTSVLQATPPSADSFHPQPDNNTGPRCLSKTSSHAAPALGKSHCTGKLRHFLGASEQFLCHSSSSDVIEKRKEATRRTPSSADPLGSDRLPSPTAVEEDRKVTAEEAVAALPSQAPFDDPGGIPHGRGQFAAWEAAENVPPASQKRSPAHQEPGTLDNTGSGNFLEAAQGGKTTCFESQLLICDVENSACLSGPNQDQVQCLEASASLEEGRASPRQGTVLPGALRGVEPEAPSQQHVKRETSVGSGPAEACRAGSEGPRPAAPPDRRPTGVREEVPRRCPQEISGCVASWGSTEGSRTLRPSGGQEDSETHSCRQPCDPQPIAPHARSSPSMPVPPFPYRGGDLGKGTSKAAPHTCHPPCMVASRARGMDERGEGHSREPDMLLACGLEPKCINVELRPADGDPPEPSIAAAVLPLAQGGHSLSAPDGKTSSLSHLVADKRSVGDPEKTFAEKKAGTELEASPFLISRCSEPPRRFQDSSAGGQRAQGSQPKPGPPATAGRPHTLNLSEGSVGHELLMGPQDGTNAIRCLPEKSQRSSESRDHSGLDPQAKFVAKLKYISSPWVDSPWEEEEQQRDQASGGGEDPTRGSSPLHTDEGCLGSCQIRGAGGEEMAVPRPTVSKMFSSGFGDSATVHLEHRGARGPVAQGSGPPSPGGEQLEPHHRRSLPVIAISGPRHYGPQFSVVSSSRSLQELNLSVEPPSPTDEKIQEPRRLWTPHLGGSSSGKSVVRPSLKAEGCDQEASPDLGDSAAVPRRLQSAPTPYPTTSALSCMPTPDLMASLEQAQQGKPERLGGQARPEEPQSEAGGGALPSGSSDINPCVLPWRPEGPVCIGWKQYGFGSAVDVSRGHTSQGLIPPSVARSSSIDDGLGDQNSPLRSHRSTCASARGLLSTCSSIQEARGSHEPWEVWGSSFALGTPHILLSSEGAAPTHGPDRRAQFPGTPDEASGLRREPPRAEGSAAGPVDEIMLLYPAEAGDPAGQPRMSTLEQGTQTPGCRPCWSYTDICSAQSDLASWASMHNLSLHLSQLLHSTSELLGSLSQPSVAEKERNAKRETPGEAPQALMMDGCTQTTMDEAVQTDRASLPLHLQAPEANSQKISVVLDRLGSVMSAMSQKQRHVPGTLQKRKTEETGWKTTGPLDLQEESTHCRPQSLPVLSPHLSFQKVPFGQNLLSVSPQPSPDASLPPSPRPEEPSCLAVSSPGLSASPSPGRCSDTAEFFRQPRVQKAQRPTSALLVDRASSPILTLSASPQGLGLPLGALSLSAPSALSLEGRRNHISSPGLPLCAPRPPVGHYSHTTDESGSSQRLGAPCGEGRSSLEGGDRRSFLEASSSGSPQQSTKLQVRFVEQPLQRHQPRTTTRVQSRPLPPAPRSRNQRGADGFVPEDMASLACDPLSSRGPSQRQSRTESGGESSESPKPPLPTLDIPSSQGGPQCRSPCPFFELTETLGLQGCILGPTEACQPEGLLRPSSQMHTAPEPQHHSLGDLPVHNKFSDWCGVQDGFPGGLGVMDLPGARCDCSSGEQGQRPPEPPADQSQAPEWSQREQIPLQVGAQNLSLSVELTEAKLHHGFGEADALLQVLQSGTGEALAAEEPEPHPQGELYAWPKQTLENLRRERAERLQNFRRARSLSPQKQLSFPSSWDLPTRDLGLPSRRREYLQQLRRDVVETTRSPGSASRSAHPPSDIELMLQEYQRAREEAKVEIARARDRLRERTEQEKLRIRQQIISQLLRVGRGQASDFREEEKLHTLAASSSRCTSSDGSLSSGVTSGYNSSPALPGQLQSPDSVVDTNLPDSRDSWMGDVRGRSAVRNSHLNLAGSAWKSLAYSRRASLGSCCCSPSSLSSLGTSSSSSYRDLAKHIVDISMADVMAACSDNLNNLFSHRAAAGWNHQGEEQEVQLYNKVFSSTRHGFLGAGVVSQPLSHVWAAVSDPTLWPLYHQPIQTARLHQRVTNSINLVYLVCNTALCALKQPRDFCCVCVEAKEGPLSIMAAQSVYDVSMPRPSREMVRGEILPSAWILQPLTVEGKEVTRVIYLAQVELGAPGFPPQLLSSFIKQQPLVIARLASFLGS
ncbi:stAR-related lipid transfer protein 9 isoform X2 [Camelus bactrianus]|uniref:StAR-related lipid transfer protein 9 isoform X2 n=1 Tax=Camelus bactrianus TaxID=9837 RepID=A0AC58QIF6_CAMBA